VAALPAGGDGPESSSARDASAAGEAQNGSMDSLAAGRTGIGVHQRRKVFEMRNQYTLTGENGEAIGAIEQVTQSPFTFLARLISGFDVALPVTLDVTTSHGAVAMRLHKPWFRFRVTVTDPDGAVLGHVRKRMRLGKAVFTVTGPSGEPLGQLRAENWRARDFRFDGASGTEVARVTKAWRGLLTEAFTDADSYAVTFPPTTDEPLRRLALASALAVDLTMKQKDYGSPLDALDIG
jgi:Scramblase